MTKPIEEEVEDGFDDFSDDFESDVDEDLDLDDFSDDDFGDEEPAPSKDDDILDKQYEGAVKANPKRMTATQLRKTERIIEGIISDAELSSPEGQMKAWQKLRDNSDISQPKPYAINMTCTENDVIDHPSFGTGFVIQLLSPTKVEILFEQGIKRLICNK